MSFKPLTLNCSTDVAPNDEVVTFYVENVIVVRMKYFTSSTKCFIERFKNGQSIGGGECNDECDCQQGTSYIWFYNGTVNSNPMTFTCIGGFLSGAEHDSVVVYQAEKPSSISPDRTTFYVNETGRTEQIKCEAICFPECNYTWSTPEGVVQNSVLYIPNVFKNHTGNYTCKAWNILDELNTTIEIVVQYRPSIEVTPVKHPYYVKENDKHITISCVVIDAYPSSAIKYIFVSPNGSIIESQNYTFSRIEKKHNGTYTCTARNVAGESDDASLAVNVLYGPVIVEMYNVNITEKTSFIRICNVTANPFPVRVWWTRSKEPNYSVEGKQLEIRNITRHLSDIFTCNAQNLLVPSFGSSTNISTNESFALNVQFKPSLDTTRPFSPSHISVTENNTLVLTVTIIGNPIPAIEWIFKGQTVLNMCNFSTILSNTTTNGFLTSSSISLTSVKSSNFGEYTLIAKSTVGTFFRRFVVYEGGETIPPLLVYVVCKNTSATVIWNHIVNGGSSFEFYLQYAEKGQYVTSDILHLNATIQPMVYTVTALAPNRTYSFSILAVNLLAQFKSQTLECVTDASPIKQEMCELTNEYTGMFVAGITTLTVGLLSLVAAVFCVVRNSLKKKTCESSKSDVYTDVHRDKPVFVTDAYSTLQADAVSRPVQEQSEVNTYEECHKKPETHAYSTLDIATESRPQVQSVNNYEVCRKQTEEHSFSSLGTKESGQNDSRKKQGVYDNLKI